MIFFTYAVILLAVAFLYLFACVDAEGDGIMSIMKVFFWARLPNTLKSIASRLCGRRFVWFIERIFRYICYEPNPLVQIVYFVCAFGGFYVYVTEGFPMIPNDRVGVWHIYVGSAIMIACYASYFLACWVDPGVIKKDCDK